MKRRHEQAERRNRELWDELAPVHGRAYRNVTVLREGGCGIHPLEREELGEVRGKSLLHLQCHIGTDSLSWARLGAVVTGVDFSRKSLEQAERLRDELGLEARFVHSNVYQLKQRLADRFQIVYTSAGVLCWLHDLAAWAAIIEHFLEPGGVLYLLESHPVLNTLDDESAGPPQVIRPYFHHDEPTVWDDDHPDYADPSYIPRSPSYEWHWSLSDVVNAVIGAGLRVERLNEHPLLFFKAVPDMLEAGRGWYRWPGYEDKLPLAFSLLARKPAL
jgi:SAM-dependent methyltransferase